MVAVGSTPPEAEKTSGENEPCSIFQAPVDGHNVTGYKIALMCEKSLSQGRVCYNILRARNLCL